MYVVQLFYPKEHYLALEVVMRVVHDMVGHHLKAGYLIGSQEDGNAV